MRRSSPQTQTGNVEDAGPRLEKDLDVIQRRINLLTGSKAAEGHSTVSSSFVSGIRRVTEEKKYNDAESVERFPVIEKILAKIVEFDREVLRCTAPASTSEKSRGNSADGDLFCLPTHFAVTDRLLELYNQVQRVASIKPACHTMNPVTDSKQSLNLNLSQELRTRMAPNAREVGLLNVSGVAFQAATNGISKGQQNQEVRESFPLLESPLMAPEIEPITAPVMAPIIAPNIAADLKLLEEEKSANAALNLMVANLADQLAASKELLCKAQAAAVVSSKEITVLKEELEYKSKFHYSYQCGVEQQLTTNTSDLATTKAELDSAKLQLAAFEKRTSGLEGRLETELVANKSITASITAAANNLDSDDFTGRITSTALAGESRTALDALLNALSRCLDRHRMDRVALSTTVESLTFEVADVISVKNILKEDYNSVISKNELLEKECSSLKAQQEKFEESSRQQLQNQLQTSRRMSDTKLKTSQLDLAGQIRIKDEQIRMKDDQLKVKDDKIRVLLSSLAASTKQCADLESIPATLRELYKNLATTEADKRSQKVEIARLNEEVAQHKALAESLKRKVREMSGKDVAFLDSFEEVLNGEMAAMKWAFEAKLRLAKDKVDALSQKHAQEIVRMEGEKSPSVSTKK